MFVRRIGENTDCSGSLWYNLGDLNKTEAFTNHFKSIFSDHILCCFPTGNPVRGHVPSHIVLYSQEVFLELEDLKPAFHIIAPVATVVEKRVLTQMHFLSDASDRVLPYNRHCRSTS